MLKGKRPHEAPVLEFKLQAYNERLQTNTCLEESDRATLWSRWVWGVDLEEKYTAGILFNEAHLLGILVCRDMMLHLGRNHYTCSTVDVAHIPTQFTLAPVAKFDAMSSKTLMTTLRVIQQSWAPALYGRAGSEATAEEWRAVEKLVHMCAHRLGCLLHFSSPSEEVFDDAEATELLPDGELGLTDASTRSALDVLVVLFRHLDLHNRAVSPQERDTSRVEREVMLPHAVEAAKDEFYKTAMHFDVFPGARLAYMHKFPGMYNCISQVAYYHNENYERRQHNQSRDAIDILPVLLHMQPDVPLVLEEQAAPKDTAVYWMLLSGRIYLMRNGTPVWHPCAFRLFLARKDPN